MGIFRFAKLKKSTYCHISNFKLSDRRAWQKDFEERGWGGNREDCGRSTVEETVQTNSEYRITSTVYPVKWSIDQ